MIVFFKTIEIGLDTCFAVALSLLVLRNPLLMLNAQHAKLRDANFRLNTLDRALMCMYRYSIIWLGVWHLAVLIAYYPLGQTDRLLLVHHALTVVMAILIHQFGFYNVYITLPLLGHYVVTLLPFGITYTLYASIYVGIVLWLGTLIAAGAYDAYPANFRVEGHALFMVVVVHTGNLLEFGFSTRLESMRELYAMLPLFMLGVTATLLILAAFYLPLGWWVAQRARLLRSTLRDVWRGRFCPVCLL